MTEAVRLQAVVFDLDGLLFNTEELYEEVGSQLLQRRGKQFTTELRDRMMGRPSRVALQEMIDWYGLEDTVERLQADTDEVFPQILQTRLAPMPGAVELLGALENANIPKAIATSSRRVFVTMVLAQFGFEPRFQFILAAEDVVQGKPYPEIYQTAARQFGLPPHRVLVLEDSQAGYQAAIAAGAITIAVPGDHSRNHNFEGVALRADTLADRRIYDMLGLAK
jgi:HAD superfamily hydrolase (TIGR01509 family)